MSRVLVIAGLLAVSLFLLAGSTAAATAGGPVRCGLLERLPGLADRPAPPPPVALRTDGKLTRDAFGGDYQVRESESFALKWTGADVSEDAAEVILEALEDSWHLFIDTLGHRPPTGSDAYRVNAYVSRPEDNPSIDFGGGYAWIDDDGYPYLVLSHELLGGDEATLRHVAAHEFYHDIQLSILVYFEDDAFWYWEATAEWAAQELYPDDVRPYGFIGAYALAPELALFHYGDPFGDPISGVHQYGASVFPRYLTQHFEDPSLIPASWETAAQGDDPLRVLDDLVGGGMLADLFASFAARNAFWDYPQREILLAVVNAYAQFFPEVSGVVAEVGAQGTAGWVTPPAARLPRPLGYNLIAIRPPSEGLLVVAVDADAAGSQGAPARMFATVAREGGGGFEYAPIDLASGPDMSGEVELELSSEDELVYLVVAAAADVRSGETFGYRFRVDVREAQPLPEEPGDEAGCGCGASGQAPSSLALALVVLLLWRPRYGRR